MVSIQGPQGQVEVEQTQQDNPSDVARTSRAQQAVTDQITTTSNEDRARQQLGLQQTMQDALRAFSLQGGTSGINEVLGKLDPTQRQLATHLTNQFLTQMREQASAQFAAQKAGGQSSGNPPGGNNGGSGGQAETTALGTAAASMTTQSDLNTASGSGSDDDSSDDQSRLGNSTSKDTMGSTDTNSNLNNALTSQSDTPYVTQVIQGAVSGVYSQIVSLANKMQNAVNQSGQINNIESLYNNALASFPPNSPATATASVPVYNVSLNSSTGQVTIQYQGVQSLTQAQIQAAYNNVDGVKSSMSDMSTMDQINLQQLMQQKNQFEEVFSNMLKQGQDTASGLLNNLK